MGFFALANIRNDKDKWITFTGREKQVAYDIDQLPSTHPIMLPVLTVQDSELNYDAITYAKGASLLIQLSLYIGENKFLKAINSYLKKFSYSNAEFNDILNALEKVTDKNLKNWRNKWLLTKGCTEVYFDNDKNLIQRPAKFSDKIIRPLTLSIDGYSLKNNKLVKVFSKDVTIDKEKTKFIPPKKSDIILLNSNDNNYVKVLYKKETLLFLKENIFKINNKFTRTVVWTNLWSACQDGILPATEYIDLVLSSMLSNKEDISMVVESNSLRVIKILSNYFRKNTELYKKIANACIEILQKNKNNLNYKSACIKILSFCAIDKVSVNFIKKALESSGYSLEQKWQLVLPLAKVNQITKTELIKLFNEDKSNLYKEFYFECLASYPSAKTKNDAWEKIKSKKLDNFEFRATMHGFMNYTDAQFVKPYLKKYFSHLNSVWNTETFETRISYTNYMYPIYGKNETLELTKTFLKTSKNSALNRVLKDLAEKLKSTLKVSDSKINSL
jgi:aminopeptidase N